MGATAVTELEGWQRGEFSAAGFTHTTYRKGTGPGVVVVHEIPGITPGVLRFAEEVVAAGFTVVMPLLVGEVGRDVSQGYLMGSMSKICVSREFTTMAMKKTSPVIAYLRALARQLHEDVGGPGVGAIGMCFSGGFALGMMLDDLMIAPVLSQPSLPFAMGRGRSADLNLSPDDAVVIANRAAAGCQVLGLRYTGDKLVGDRFTSLRTLLGDAFLAVEFPSTKKSDHSVLTEQRQEEGVARVLGFLREKLLT
ncbi:MAG: dienelactone hydrolase family protein [Acidobacteria bacterium]|jgi:dienelactone hydrolase|nr:dienelactone hydrolase family protein [Acidobacteriota bacterium]